MILGLLGVTLLPACPLLDLQADVQSACVRYSDVAVDPEPQVSATIEKSFTVDDLDSLKQLADDGFQLSFASGDVATASGVSDFSFVKSATVDVASGDADSTLPTLEFNCTNCGSAATELDFTPADAGSGSTSAATIDAKPYFDSGSLIVTVGLTGMPPAVAWSMDVDVCVTGTASYEVNE
ncbi:MAG TPA: hypothetical protein VGG28_16635 [Kofleriaceae bacterium]